MGVLTVHLVKVTHLKDDDGIGAGQSDPYVKFELEQDNMLFDKDFGEQKSSKKQDETNPEYDETFQFEIPDDIGLQNVVLSCKIMDDDIIGDDKIGKCKIKLDEMELGPDPVPVERVVDDNWFSKDARIFMNLSFTS